MDDRYRRSFALPACYLKSLARGHQGDRKEGHTLGGGRRSNGRSNASHGGIAGAKAQRNEVALLRLPSAGTTGLSIGRGGRYLTLLDVMPSRQNGSAK